MEGGRDVFGEDEKYGAYVLASDYEALAADRDSFKLGMATANEEWRKAQARYRELQLRNEALEPALRSIAANTCCDKCQEAALVARAALETEVKP
jgi:hypothetical protein